MRDFLWLMGNIGVWAVIVIASLVLIVVVGAILHTVWTNPEPLKQAFESVLPMGADI